MAAANATKNIRSNINRCVVGKIVLSTVFDRPFTGSKVRALTTISTDSSVVEQKQTKKRSNTFGAPSERGQFYTGNSAIVMNADWLAVHRAISPAVRLNFPPPVGTTTNIWIMRMLAER